jgi:hypothetical protein
VLRFLDRVLLGMVMSVIVVILERAVLRGTRKKPAAGLGSPSGD